MNPLLGTESPPQRLKAGATTSIITGTETRALLLLDASYKEYLCRFSPSVTFPTAIYLVIWRLSHGRRVLVCLTDRFISYNVRYAVTL